MILHLDLLLALSIPSLLVSYMPAAPLRLPPHRRIGLEKGQVPLPGPRQGWDDGL